LIKDGANVLDPSIPLRESLRWLRAMLPTTGRLMDPIEWLRTCDCTGGTASADGAGEGDTEGPDGTPGSAIAGPGVPAAGDVASAPFGPGVPGVVGVERPDGMPADWERKMADCGRAAPLGRAKGLLRRCDMVRVARGCR
jgi:hypothetical protein